MTNDKTRTTQSTQNSRKFHQIYYTKSIEIDKQKKYKEGQELSIKTKITRIGYKTNSHNPLN